MSAPVRTGVEVLASRPQRLAGRRWALATNFTGVMPDLTRGVDALLAAGVHITCILGPEHGVRGAVQAGLTEGDGIDERTGLPVRETYEAEPAAVDNLLDEIGVDGLIFDMQDIGVRFYTYVWTMHDLMLSAARRGLEFVVLDRPNPLTGHGVTGPGVRAGFESFVGRINIPIRHGLTAGELARLVARRSCPGLNLTVVPMSGWSRAAWFSQTGLPWVPPSPNMPTPDTALAFCGTGLIEGTNLSEGRGTTRPFELLGAPFVDARWVEALRGAELPGVLFREAWFTPTFHKYAGELLRGVQLHIIDRNVFEPVACGMTIIDAAARLYPDQFTFLPSATSASLPAIDVLWGSAELRQAIGRRVAVDRITTQNNSFRDVGAGDHLMYG